MRKTPIRHLVRPHKRKGKGVQGFTRGSGNQPNRRSRVVGTLNKPEPDKPDYWNYWIDLNDIVQVVGKYKIGKIVETYPSRGKANVHWIHPFTEVPSGSGSIIPLKDLRKVIEVCGTRESRLIIQRDKQGNIVGHKKLNRYLVVIEDEDGETHHVDGPVQHRRSPKFVRDLKKKYRLEKQLREKNLCRRFGID